MIKQLRYTIILILLLCSSAGCSWSGNFSNPFSSSPLFKQPTDVTGLDNIRHRQRKIDVQSEKFKIMHSYQFEVTKHDGINAEEAAIIAQSEIIFRGYENEYHIMKPSVQQIDQSVWGVEFYPINVTLKDSISKPNLLITVDQKDGSIEWSFII